MAVASVVKEEQDADQRTNTSTNPNGESDGSSRSTPSTNSANPAQKGGASGSTPRGTSTTVKGGGSRGEVVIEKQTCSPMKTKDLVEAIAQSTAQATTNGKGSPNKLA